MKKILIVNVFLFHIMHISKAAYCDDVVKETPTMYETPILVEKKDGVLFFNDAKGRTFYFKGSNIVQFKQSWDMRIFIPLLVAIVASLSSIILSVINYRQMKRGKWHEIWVTDVLNTLNNLYGEVNTMINGELGSKYESTTLQKTKVHLVSLLGFDSGSNSLNTHFDEIKRAITTKANVEEVYSLLTKISQIVYDEIKK